MTYYDITACGPKHADAAGSGTTGATIKLPEHFKVNSLLIKTTFHRLISSSTEAGSQKTGWQLKAHTPSSNATRACLSRGCPGVRRARNADVTDTKQPLQLGRRLD